jgi:hypothetical protein
MYVWYALFSLYVCMNVFIMVVVNRYLSIHTYRRAHHCDEEIDGGERDDKRWIEDGTARLHGGYTTIYGMRMEDVLLLFPSTSVSYCSR